jgi:SPOR domain
MAGADDIQDGEERALHANDDTEQPYELGLEDEDERLPWLESDDDYDYDEGIDGGRILGFALLGLVALAAIVGAIWWSTHRTPDATLVADGSTVAAPGPYKEAPKNAGGKTFEGTGDTAFAVSEGQTRAVRLGEPAAVAAAAAASASASASPAAKPGFDLAPKPSAAPTHSAAPAAASGAPGTLVQVGAYSNRSQAEAAWSKLSGHYSALSGQHHQIVEGQADIGTVFRLQALPGSGDAARSLCGRLKGAGLACQVK